MKPLPSKITLGGALTVSRLGFGTIHLTEHRGFGSARRDAVQLLKRAVELGVDFIDTADSYGPGTAETVVREALHPYHGITVATKGGFEHPAESEWKVNGHPKHLKAAVDCSLSRLRLEQIPLYYLHTPDKAVPYKESLGCIKDLHAAGKIRSSGSRMWKSSTCARRKRSWATHWCRCRIITTSCFTTAPTSIGRTPRKSLMNAS